MTTIYIIRHAQAEGNLYRRCHGWHNGLVTVQGRAQIKALERRFDGVRFDAVYSSDLYRTMATAGAIYRPRGLTLRTDPALREINTGRWEDQPWGKLFYDEGDSLSAFLHCDPDWQVEGSETHPQVRARIHAAVARIAQAHPGQTVAAVSHGCAIRAGLSAWLGLPPEQMDQIPLSDNTGVSKLELEDGQVRVACYNDSSHLGGAAAPIRAGGHHGLLSMEHSAIHFRPLRLPQDQELYLAARTEGAADGFDGAPAPGGTFLALLGDSPAGVLQLDPDRDAGQRVGWVSALYLAPQRRSHGLGVQLLGQAVSLYRGMGRQFLRLCCPLEHNRAEAFYLSHGFYRVAQTSAGAGHRDAMEKYIGLEL